MIGILDYKIGNVGSVANALTKLNIPFVLTSDKTVLEKTTALILPGVGSANQGMENLIKLELKNFLIDQIKSGKPFLGICLGMQLLFDNSEEGNTKCLGVLRGKVKKFRKEEKIPQIGWNKVEPMDKYFYFVNSYYCEPEDKSIIAGKTKYGEEFASIIKYKNIFATQFHPEKSGKDGFQLLKDWTRHLRGDPKGLLGWWRNQEKVIC
ncbi:imidazole glycerol phosphate synthase subunit HisH [Candidatus Gottesmanbacteria bacterium]|nr:imidazole glycerol phosphate synthase subunit HisH [Candidatus Gottesmanbacteria bacterium]